MPKTLLRFVAPMTLTLALGACGGGTTGVSTSDGENTSGGGTNNDWTPVATVTLSWGAPSTRVDSTPISLSEIRGYRLYYGNQANNTPYVVQISSSSATSKALSLPAGIWYFRVSAYDADGIEGPKSAAQQLTL